MSMYIFSFVHPTDTVFYLPDIDVINLAHWYIFILVDTFLFPAVKDPIRSVHLKFNA